jgi:hypothetical protein
VREAVESVSGGAVVAANCAIGAVGAAVVAARGVVETPETCFGQVEA